MLNKAITDKLNEQINLEFYSSNVYLQMSSWCSKHGYEGAAAFLLRHADEELEHMQKLFKYVSCLLYTSICTIQPSIYSIAKFL